MSDIEGWQSDRTKKHSGGNLNGMQNEGRSSTGSVLPGENDIAIPFEADDMYIDMDISPINFPNSSADIHSNLESKPPESHGASGIMAEFIPISRAVRYQTGKLTLRRTQESLISGNKTIPD
ncbi:hypothetical protein D5086_026901 [Populus alba]|uniref:Uncharacterized protein n=1 Tax=Populus alba TaxID=43335 RepID=A0ACC4B389_POPAL